MTSLGRYQLLGELGRGGMAVVYAGLAHGEAGFRKPVVVKRIHPHLTRDERFVRMLIREAKLTVLLDHPNVAQVLELGREADDYFIVLERVDGADLSRLQKSADRAGVKLPPSLAAHICREVLAALRYAHGVVGDDGTPLGVVHRDVTPSNILVDRHGRVKLTDFGVAHALVGSEPSRKGVTGKLSYMSPEQARAEAVDARSDLYSVGLVLFELLTGRRAIDGEGDMELWNAACAGAEGAVADADAELPPGFAAFLRRALRAEPEGRFADAADMREALAPLADDVERGRDRLAELVTLLAPADGDDPITRSLGSPGAAPQATTRSETLVTRPGDKLTPPPGLASLASPRRRRTGLLPVAALVAVAAAVGAGVIWSGARLRGGGDADGGSAVGVVDPEVEPRPPAAGPPKDVSSAPLETGAGAPSPADRGGRSGQGESVEPSPFLDEDGDASEHGDEIPQDDGATWRSKGVELAPAVQAAGGAPGELSVIVMKGTGLVHVDAPGWIDSWSPFTQRPLAAGTWTVTVDNPDADLSWTGEVTMPPGGNAGVMIRRGTDGDWEVTVTP